MDISVQYPFNKTETFSVCFVTETFPPEVNGVAMTLQRLVRGLESRGHRVSVIRPGQNGEKSTSDDSHLTLVRGLPLPGYSGLQFGLPSSGRIKRHFQTHRPDVIYVATEGPLGNTTLKLARKFNIPVISGFHTNFHAYMKHYRAGVLGKLAIRYLRKFHNQTVFTLVPGNDIKAQLEAHGFENIRVMERGVDCTLFSPARRSAELRNTWGAESHIPVVINVGRLAAEKNIGLFIDCVRKMQGVNPGVKGVLVGKGPMFDRLRKRNPEFIFCGEKTGEELATHYASADIFLFPSETETFGNVTLEAMASGLNVLAFNYAAAHQHITHGVNGYLAAEHSRDDFVNKSLKILESGNAEKKRISKNARSYSQRIDWQSILQKFEVLLSAAIRGPL